MKNKQSVEEQVTELTTAQQDKILKVGKISVIIQAIFLVPLLIYAICGLLFIGSVASSMTSGLGLLYGSFSVGLVLCYIPQLIVVIVVKVKYPFYSDAKYRYISKMRKNKK